MYSKVLLSRINANTYSEPFLDTDQIDEECSDRLLKTEVEVEGNPF